MTHGQKTSRLGSIALRVGASAVFIPCLIIITRRGGWHFLALIDLVIILGMWEFYRMMENKGCLPHRWIGIATGLLLSALSFAHYEGYPGLLLTLALLATAGLELTRRGDECSSIGNTSTTVLGVAYVAFMASHMVMLRELPREVGVPYSEGASFVFLAFVATWSCDTGAFFVGSLFGKHPLLPRVSEKKTREGVVGGVVLAVAGVLVARYTFADFLETWHAAVIGVILAAAGIIGDLVESMIKRDADIKDASGAIPGHGGVLDRFDSLLFAAPLLYYILKFVIF